jgi:DhnA family fructose-bisphosphate aldolase class Ia
MPLMIEPLVFQPNAKAGGYMVDGDLAKIIPLVRQAVELGADVIKADPTDDVSQYHRVIEIAGGIPVLVRGGSRAPEAEILLRTAALLAQGAAGIVYGRNIIQHPHPARITRALMAVVHEGASPEAALAILQGA